MITSSENKFFSIKFRKKGNVLTEEFRGDVRIEGESRTLSRNDLPLREEVLDLTHVPVVCIGGKRGSRQDRRLEEFRKSASDFGGVIYLLPYDWSWGWSDGHLILPSRQILGGQRVSGGRPEEKLVDFRWLPDGRYVADRARVLHGKTVEVLQKEVEQEPGTEKIAERLCQGFGCFEHSDPLVKAAAEVRSDLQDLENRRVLLSGEPARDMSALVRERLTAKLQAVGVRFVRDIPADFGLAAEEVAPELVAARDTLGTVEIPGLGRRLLEKQYAEFGFGNPVPVVVITADELGRLTVWPFDRVYPVLSELGATRIEWALRDAVEAPEAERIGKIREYFAERWLDIQRSSNRPKDETVADPSQVDPPGTPAPVVWGIDLRTGEEKRAYAALVHQVVGAKGRFVDRGWGICWFDSAEEAVAADAEGREDADSLVYARRLEEELTRGVEEPLPVAIPPPYQRVAPTVAHVMELLGFAPGQFRIGGQGPVRVCTDPGDSYYSEVRGREVALRHAEFADRWWHKDGDSVVVFANATAENILRHLDAAERDLGVAREKIPAVREALQGEDREAKEAAEKAWGAFSAKLRASPIFACLPPGYSLDRETISAAWAKAARLCELQKAGNILVNWGGHFRVMGATCQADYWVIRPDGSLRLPTSTGYRKRYMDEGEKTWRLVGTEELALSWSKAFTAAHHEFVVAKLPEGGCTPAQLEAVSRIEAELEKRWSDALGMSGKASPGIGMGWGLTARPTRVAVKVVIQPPLAKPVPAPAAEQKNPVVETVFEDIGDRQFRCPICRGTEKLSKADDRRYKAGDQMPIICPSGHKGVAKKT